MGLYKRDGSKQWWFTLHDPRTGKRIRKSCGTSDKQLAKMVYQRFEASLLLGTTLSLTSERKACKIWEDAAKRWLYETSYKKDRINDICKLTWLQNHLGGMALEEITASKLRLILEAKAAEASYSTANKYLALTKAILNRAANEWEWLDKAPFLRPYKVAKIRIRFLTKQEAQILLKELPTHLADMMAFTLCTGLRASNVTQLKWTQIDLGRGHMWIHGDEAKAGKDIAVPLNMTAQAILKRQIGKNTVYVFVYRGHPVTSPNNHAWRKALKRAGVVDFRWHDLRHTWASWHAQAGTPLHVLQELGGWHSFEMVRRYAHLTSEHLAKFTVNTDMLNY